VLLLMLCWDSSPLGVRDPFVRPTPGPWVLLPKVLLLLLLLWATHPSLGAPIGTPGLLLGAQVLLPLLCWDCSSCCGACCCCTSVWGLRSWLLGSSVLATSRTAVGA
jgi:hypothetical protein